MHIKNKVQYCCCSVAKLCPTLCNPTDCNTAGFSVLYHFLEFAHTYFHWVDDAIQPSHPLLPPSTLSLFQLQGLFKWISSLHQAAKILEIQHQHQLFQWMFRVAFLFDWLVWSPCYPGDSQESLPEPHLKSLTSSAFSLLYCPTLTSVHDCWENHSFDYTDLCDFSKVMSLLFNTLSRLVKALRPKTISNSFFLPKTFLQGTSAF